MIFSKEEVEQFAFDRRKTQAKTVAGALAHWAVPYARSHDPVDKAIGGAVASLVAYAVEAGKSDAWLVSNYKRKVRQVLRKHLDEQLDLFDTELHKLRSMRR